METSDNNGALAPAAAALTPTLASAPAPEVRADQISVVLNITANGPPEAAEELARAVQRAAGVLVPGLPLVGKD